MTDPRSTLRLGTRKSALALAQSGMMARALEAAHPGLTVELITISTVGDRTQDRPITAVGTAGMFVKELEQALLDGRVDLAVHSCKDMPTEMTAGLVIACVPPRELPFDALVTRDGLELDALPHGARVGTGSPRRRVQIMARRPDLKLLDLRGNIDTRLSRLDGGEYDAIVLAAAGLNRLGVTNRPWRALTPDLMLPAVAQGALALQTRADDDASRARVSVLDCASTHRSVLAERAFLAGLGGGCLAPIAALAQADDEGGMSLQGLVGSLEDGLVLRDRLRAAPQGTVKPDPLALGARLAERMLAGGAAAFLARASAEAARLESPGLPAPGALPSAGSGAPEPR